MLIQIIMISLGGFFGAISRYWISLWFGKHFSASFPFATLLVNLIGSFLLGYTIGAGLEGPIYSFIGIGYFGAFTTFSTFKLENIHMFAGKKFKVLAVYLTASYTFGILLAFAGFKAAGI
ncbi:fluoride efflux transporter CrcB [Bacillus sp. Marseille-Q1617]|uniref:fluoride efflux transporter CrcB n=1 Tax=Bacillus sp. Marseille-Q1617 TaxID=2736887 RepID=UPI00158A0828|nr:fluoride efflux transporter CrcB [Bacillus sp. Marseille-Q1617]